MEITVTIQQAGETIAVIKPIGELNASNFMELVDKASEVYNHQAKRLVLDLSEVAKITSAGQVAIHKVALIFSGVEQDVEADKNPDFTHSSNARRFVKLLNPIPEVDQALEKAGFKLFFKVYPTLEEAINSFK